MSSWSNFAVNHFDIYIYMLTKKTVAAWMFNNLHFFSHKVDMILQANGCKYQLR